MVIHANFRKKVKRIFATVFAAITLFSVGACKSGSDSDSSSSSNVAIQIPGNAGGNSGSSIIVSDSNKTFISNGRSDYKIVIPAESQEDKNLNLAVQDLSHFLKMSTGVTLSVVTDDQISYSSSSKIISIGMTDALEASGLSQDLDKLKLTGYKIVTKDDSVFLWGKTNQANAYAVYEFLEHEIGFEQYSADEIFYEETTDLKLKNFAVLDNPSFEFYGAPTGAYTYGSQAAQQRAHFITWHGFMGGKGGNTHNTWNYLPPTTYMEEHPKWYAKGASLSDYAFQLCYNAQGDPDEFNLMFETFMNVFIQTVLDAPDTSYFAITHQDLAGWCSCDVCAAEREKYGTGAGTMVKFCNRVSDATAEYFKEHNIDREIYIVFFAYDATVGAPANLVNGKWEPIDDEVRCRDNVIPWYAFMMDFTKTLTHEKNKFFKDSIDAWAGTSKQILIWSYGANFSDYFYPLETFSTMQENYQYYYSVGAKYVYEQCQWEVTVTPGYSALKAYLVSKLGWNVYEDFDALVNNFFENYYKEAAKAMLEGFNFYRTFSQYQYDELGMNGTIYADVIDVKYWPRGAVLSLLEKFQEAYKAIESLKITDPDKHALLYERIKLEELAFKKIELQLYSGYYSNAELSVALKNFKKDCLNVGISNYKEHTTITVLFDKLGID